MVSQHSLLTLALISVSTLFNSLATAATKRQFTLNGDELAYQHKHNGCKLQCFHHWLSEKTQVPECATWLFDSGTFESGRYRNEDIARCMCEATPIERDLFEECFFQCGDQDMLNDVYSKGDCGIAIVLEEDHQTIPSLAEDQDSSIETSLLILIVDTLSEDKPSIQTSSAARKGKSRFISILLLALFLFINFGGVMADHEEEEEEEEVVYKNGIAWSENDQAPECLATCDVLSMETIPQCIKDAFPELADAFETPGWENTIDYDQAMEISNAMSCVCTDAVFIKDLAGCVFGESCGRNSTAIYDALSFGYKYCGISYNITYPAPTEVVELLDITVPSYAIVPTTISGVPQATSWPGNLPAKTTSTASTATSSASINSNSTSNTTNSAMKTGPSSFLAILSSLLVLGLFSTSVTAQEEVEQECQSGCENITLPCPVDFASASDEELLASVTCACTDRDYLNLAWTCEMESSCAAGNSSYINGQLESLFSACSSVNITLPPVEEYFREIDVTVPSDISLTSISDATATAIPSLPTTISPGTNSTVSSASSTSTGTRNNVTMSATPSATPSRSNNAESVSATASSAGAASTTDDAGGSAMRNGASFGVLAAVVLGALML